MQLAHEFIVPLRVLYKSRVQLCEAQLALHSVIYFHSQGTHHYTWRLCWVIGVSVLMRSISDPFYCQSLQMYSTKVRENLMEDAFDSKRKLNKTTRSTGRVECMNKKRKILPHCRLCSSLIGSWSSSESEKCSWMESSCRSNQLWRQTDKYVFLF